MSRHLSASVSVLECSPDSRRLSQQVFNDVRAAFRRKDIRVGSSAYPIGKPDHFFFEKNVSMILGYSFGNPKRVCNHRKGKRSAVVKQRLKKFLLDFFESILIHWDIFLLRVRFKLIQTRLQNVELRIERLRLLAQRNKAVSDRGFVQSTSKVIDQFVDHSEEGHSMQVKQNGRRVGKPIIRCQ